MSDLHDTLKTLGPADWSEVPIDNPSPYLRHIFEAGELICNSVPNPPGGTELSAVKPTFPSPDSASSSQDITASEARAPAPHPDHADLQKAWGKPMKLSAKENQLGISVYKMAGKDRHGAWFARRSVHEGISFTKFKKAMQREFAESLAVQGGPGEGNVRGIGGDQRLEKKKVDGVGLLEVYQLSAQFPGPTTPREFITMLSTSDDALTDKSAGTPRHYMVVSKPVSHPNAPERNGYIRGTYESVELIRELPINPVPDKTNASASQDHELNPVEWIMVTRSDPGGGIPRFMVERGTPSSICADAAKFLDWACGKDEILDPDADQDQQVAAAAAHVQQPSTAGPSTGTSRAPQQQQDPAQQGGIVSHITSALEAGIEAYAPVSVAQYTHSYLHQDSDSSDSSSDDSSSFASAQEIPSGRVTPIAKHTAVSTDTLAASVTSTPSTKGLPQHDKELRKLDEQREKVDAKLAKKREAEDEKLKASQEKDSADQVKATEKHDKEIKKIEERRLKELAKIEHKKEKELQKAEKKRLKNLDRENLSQLSRELEANKQENALLLAQVGDLQRENLLLVNSLHQVGGAEAVQSIKQEVGTDRKRTSSNVSRK